MNQRRQTSSSNPVVSHLLIEDEKVKVFSYEKMIRGKLVKKKKIILTDDEPRFILEPSGGVCAGGGKGDKTSYYLKEIKNQQYNTIGLLNSDGILEKADIEKRYYFNKLNLVPVRSVAATETKIPTMITTNSFDINASQVDSTLSTPPPSDHSSSSSSGSSIGSNIEIKSERYPW